MCVFFYTEKLLKLSFRNSQKDGISLEIGLFIECVKKP